MTEVVVRYPPAVVAGDYVRAAAGLAVTLIPVAVLPLHPWILALFGGAGLLFAGFLAATVRRGLLRFRLDDQAITAEGPLGGVVRWQEMERLRLRYFSTRRDRREGWMELRIAGKGGSVTLDSTVDGFDLIAERAAAAARGKGLALNPVTVENFAALGIDAGNPEADRGGV